MNTQPPEKQDRRDDGSILVHSIFHTIQGEGPHAGVPAVFVRLAGCNLQCPMCDTEYTAQRLRMEPWQILRDVVFSLERQGSVRKRYDPTNLIVLTGGEPFRQNIEPFVRHVLEQSGFRIQIETNGTLYQHLPWGHRRLSVVCSPKTSVVNAKLVPHVDAFKYVARAGDINVVDGLPNFALEHPNARGLFRPNAHWNGTIYLQPADEKNEYANRRNLEQVVKSCMQFGHRLCLQLHKYAELE